MQRAKEAASGVAASAEGKAEKWSTRDPASKETAEEKKTEKVRENAPAGRTTPGDVTGTEREYATEVRIGEKFPPIGATGEPKAGGERTGDASEDPDLDRGGLREDDDDYDRIGRGNATGTGYGTTATF